MTRFRMMLAGLFVALLLPAAATAQAGVAHNASHRVFCPDLLPGDTHWQRRVDLDGLLGPSLPFPWGCAPRSCLRVPGLTTPYLPWSLSPLP